MLHRGDEVAQLVECQPQDPMDSMTSQPQDPMDSMTSQPQDPMDSVTRGLNPIRSTRNICGGFRAKLYWHSVVSVFPTSVCIRMHKNDKDPVVHVSFVDYGNMRDLTQHALVLTEKDKCTGFCTVNVNSRVMICTLNNAHWQQTSKFSALWRFELIWKDWDKYAHQYTVMILLLNCIS